MPPPTTNFSVTVTFPDGHQLGAVISQADIIVLNGLLPLSGISTLITDTTTNPVTKTLTVYLNEIEAHRVGDIITPPPSPTTTNTFFQIEFSDGTVISQTVTNDDFTIINNIASKGTFWNIGFTQIVDAQQNPTNKTLNQVLDDINAKEPSIPPPPEPENVQYRVIFNLSDSTFDQVFILSPAENQILLNHTFDPLVVLSFPLATTSSPTHVATNIISQIEIALALELEEPPQAGNKSYTMELKSSSYLSTPEGKTINIQIEVTKIGTGVDSAVALLNIKQGLTGISILNEIQNLQIGGANIFPIVFNIPDIGATGEATATLDFIVVMQFSETDQRALTEFPVMGKLVFEAPPTTPPTMKEGSILTKVLGVVATLGTASLLTGKGR